MVSGAIWFGPHDFGEFEPRTNACPWRVECFFVNQFSDWSALIMWSMQSTIFRVVAVFFGILTHRCFISEPIFIILVYQISIWRERWVSACAA